MTKTKPMTATRAKHVCDLAVSQVTGLFDAVDWTAPGMWKDARDAERVDDRWWYRSAHSVKARTGAERDAMLVLTTLDAAGGMYLLTTLYGMRKAHQLAVFLGVTHADRLLALGIDRADLRAAADFMGDARRV